MPSAVKVEKLEEIKSILAENQNFLLTTYSGMTVEQISDLRSKVREKESRLKVIKNRIFRQALMEIPEYEGILESIKEDLKGPIAVTFIGENLPEVAKVLVKYQKENDKVQIKSGCLEGKFLNKDEVKAVSDLPSKEELLAIIARGLNTPAQQIATGMNEVIASLARAIKAVGEKNGD